MFVIVLVSNRDSAEPARPSRLKVVAPLGLTSEVPETDFNVAKGFHVDPPLLLCLRLKTTDPVAS